MKIIIQKSKVKCDVGKCKNQAHYSIVSEGVSSSQYVNLCEECASDIYSVLGKQLVPKSPQNLLARAVKRGNE